MADRGPVIVCAILERRGLPIGGYDLLIAGHTRSKGLIIVTGNLREFTRVDGLRSEDWLVPSKAKATRKRTGEA